MPIRSKAAPRVGGCGVRPAWAVVGSAGLVFALSSAAGCSPKPPRPPPAPAAFLLQGDRIVVPAGSPLRSQLVLAPVTEAEIAPQIAAPAVVEADPAGLSRLLTPLAGRIVRLRVRLGDHVHAGQTVAELAAPEVSAALADDARARTQLRLAAAVRDRARAVQAIGGDSAKDVEQAQADYALAEAESIRASERLRQVGASAAVEGGGLALTAPSSGVVSDLAAAPGAYWTDPTAPLMTIADIRAVFVTANVAEKDLGAIHEGQPVRIAFAARPGETLSGRVQSVAPLLDPDTRRDKVRVAVANPDGRFRPGMFATVRFAAPAQAAPTAPTGALLLKDDATTVYVEVAPWTFERRIVETGPEQAGRTTVLRGLVAGQRVIAAGGVLLDD